MTAAPSDTPPDGPTSETPETTAGDGDDDLLRIAPARPRRSPLLAAVVIVASGLVLFQLRDDVRFALQPRAPVEIGDARKLDPANLVDNRFVAVTGMPDRRNALLFEPKGDSYRRAFWRLLGSGDRLFVRADETSTRHQLSDRFVGRLRRFDRVGWGAQISDYYKDRVRVTRMLDLDAVKRALAGGKLGDKVADRAGDPVALAPDTELGLEVDFPADIKVSLSKRQFLVEEDARHELERLGFPTASAGQTTEGWLYVIRIDPTKRDAQLKLLEDRNFPFAARRERFLSTPTQMAAAGEGAVSLTARKDHPAEYVVSDEGGKRMLKPAPPAPRTTLAWSRISSIHVAAPIVVPPDAFLLVEGDSPSDFTWTIAMAALLALFALFNVWLLVRSLRRPPAQAYSSEGGAS